jgi:para-aminobenzoate synthetase/4-amino-4-deoxychorismate lyase
MALSVAIRTLSLGAPRAGSRGLRPLVMGVGGGIVQDSVAADEWDETHWKARFLTALDPGVELFETMRATRAAGVAHRERHRSRLAASAAALGFAFDARDFDACVDRALGAMATSAPPTAPWRLRVSLRFDGRLSAAPAALLAPLHGGGDGVRLLLAPEPLPDERPLSGHKTSARATYDAGIRAAEAQGAFDMLFFDAAGRLVEGGRSNVFVRSGGRWSTPPLSDGALPGVMRALLLADPAWAARERSLSREDVLHADALMVCNALRGPLAATLAGDRRLAA